MAQERLPEQTSLASSGLCDRSFLKQHHYFKNQTKSCEATHLLFPSRVPFQRVVLKSVVPSPEMGLAKSGHNAAARPETQAPQIGLDIVGLGTKELWLCCFPFNEAGPRPLPAVHTTSQAVPTTKCPSTVHQLMTDTQTWHLTWTSQRYNSALRIGLGCHPTPHPSLLSGPICCTDHPRNVIYIFLCIKHEGSHGEDYTYPPVCGIPTKRELTILPEYLGMFGSTKRKLSGAR